MHLPPDNTTRHTLPDETAVVEHSTPNTEALEGSARTAQQLAATHQEGLHPCARTPLYQDFPAIADLLEAAYRYFLQSAEYSLVVSHAAEWMLDNYYVIQQSLRQVEQDLPPNYYVELPRLGGNDPLCGYPRIYAVALAILWEADYQLDADQLVRFALDYQTRQPLNISELWALPIMLRLGVLQMIALATSRLANLASANAMPDSMAAFRGAAGQGNHAPAEQDDTAVAHAIASLRLLESLDWAELFEKISLVHQMLFRDPSGVYPRLNFATRDQYRRVIETLHRRVELLSELEIAETVVDLAARQPLDPLPAEAPAIAIESAAAEIAAPDLEGDLPPLRLDSPRAAHVGYYLIDEGRQTLEQDIEYQPPMSERTRQGIFRHATGVYLSLVGIVALLGLGIVSAYMIHAGGSAPALMALWVLALVPVLTAGVGFANWVVTHTLPPHTLPKLDFQDGIPGSCRTALVVPALIADRKDIDHLTEEMEQHYLRNPDPQLVYVLLTDFLDADNETEASDEALLLYAQDAVARLNAKVARAPFYLLHRKRLWNASQQTWMGWERKRGKLHEFNRLLRGAPDTTYAWQFGALDQLGDIRYVITLDADTVLPRTGAAHLVGTLTHPLNRALFDAATGKVVAGYTVLQPRTEIKPVNVARSLFTRVSAGDNTLDLYTLAVSDAYQDLFGAGIFVGKGIYDVDAFERSLEGRVPENSLLSHDLFEGIHGRVGLVTDIVVYEDYPTHYFLNLKRNHRWVRGDWQLVPWLLPRSPRVGGRAPNDLALIDRWKIFDNLRRSLFAPTSLLLLILGWTMLPGSPLVWTALSLIIPGISIAGGLLSSTRHAIFSEGSWRNTVWSTRDSILRWLMFLAFLPYESQRNLDAIVRTLGRTFVTHQQMLEWTTAAQAARKHSDDDSPATLMKMLPTIIFVSLVTIAILFLHPTAFWVAAPFLITWLIAPQLADWISRPIALEITPPTPEEVRKLRMLARRTWLFYENFVGPEDNWLPPDHFQDSPRGVVAHRTSPTNIGLYLLSTLTAFDLGYVRIENLILRLKFTFETLNKLPQYRGHFLNWVDTGNLQTLPPPYVSTVDSGNLAGALIALQQGCIELQHATVWRPERWQGLLDMVAIIADQMDALPQRGSRPNVAIGALHDCLVKIEEMAQGALKDPSTALATLTELSGPQQEELNRCLMTIVTDSTGEIDADTLRAIRLYTSRMQQHVEGMTQERVERMPWLSLIAAPPAIFTAKDSSASLRRAWQNVAESIPADPLWDDLEDVLQDVQARADQLGALLAQSAYPQSNAVREGLAWCDALTNALTVSARNVESIRNDLTQLAEQARIFVDAMDFSFLYSPTKDVFHIGYNINTGELDNSYYDLLASEARLTSLIAIGKNEVPVKHWLHLARPVTQFADGERALLSWSGTMFEYLMPPLLTRTYPGTQFHQTYTSVIDQQIAYARQKDVPWGISESGFYAFDAALNYQYRAFGVPGLGLKRGLGDDLVVTPYASLLALPFRPRPVLDNLQRLEQIKGIGQYGLYEAIDYTPERLSLGQDYAVVQSYMAHHQGMIFLGIANYLLDGRMIERFHEAPVIQSVDLLLQERIPQDAPAQFPHVTEEVTTQTPAPLDDVAPWRVPGDTPMPQVHYLSNGQLSAMITNAGGGYTAGEELRLTRWRADTTLDDWGTWVYVQDLESGGLWSAGRQPTGRTGEYEEIVFHPHMAEFRRRVDATSLHMEMFVAPDANVEVRRITLSNDSDAPSRLGLASYGEIVLAPAEADKRHQAFTKLFIESEYRGDLHALMFRRRPRAATEAPAYVLHLLVRGPIDDADAWGDTSYSADRAQFIGRGKSQRAPAALEAGRWWQADWKGNVGATLDPIMALGQEIRLAPRTAGQLAFVTIQADTREQALELALRYRMWTTIESAQMRAQGAARQEMRRLGFDSARFQQSLQLLSLLLYPHAVGRAEPSILAANTLGQPGLWAFGISGDYPILLVHLGDESHIGLLQNLLQIHAHWRQQGLKIDLVIVNDRATSYDQGLHDQIFRVVRQTNSDGWLNQRGGVFVLRQDQLGNEERILLATSARVLLNGERGSLSDHLADIYRQPAALPGFIPVCTPEHLQELRDADQGWLPRPADLQFDNGLGGFTPDGSEYVIYLPPGETTPAPWINVIANPDFGFIAGEHGLGASWAINSGENRLTSWRNDPVTDAPSEVIYLRDEETAEIWSPTPQPAPEAAPYLIRHGAGYTIYEHHSHALEQRLSVYAAPDAPVKIMRLRLQNIAHTARRITVTCYAELVLGVDRETTQAYIAPEYDRTHGAIYARNAYNAEFGQRVAFLAGNKLPIGATADRADFLGRLGNLQHPAALGRIGLSDQVRAGLDPCAALQLHVDLPADGVEEIYFILGEGADHDAARALVEQFTQREAIDAAWEEDKAGWERRLGAITVETPDAAMNLLLNRWLLYQTLSCRIWGRSALYQSSGAYGFRDQLQDVLALRDSEPEITRAQILRAAAHQFEQGDVLHWWHPPSGRGVRTRIKDDLLWLPYVTAQYVAATGDTAILWEEVPFLTGPELRPDEEERYGYYPPTEQPYSLLEHCRRAIKRGLTAGPHGLPLIGSGDWNDGMNRVGIEGYGESIWLGWFIYATLTAFADLCDAAQIEGGARYRQQAEEIRIAVEAHGWDGDWYRRAYYDDGTPLGSASSIECRIDAIAQSWAVLSNAGDPHRARKGMEAVIETLVDEDTRLMLLFTPPFDKTRHDPGYIKGYLPGIRENGGQYTHAALWSIWAFAKLQDTERAQHLFRLINPILRSDTRAKASHYKVEPYVISADVYNIAPHVGRGGWTWYTGSAAWMYRVGIEAILGLQHRGDTLHIDPCIPSAWPGYKATWRYGDSQYLIHVENPTGTGVGVRWITLDGETCTSAEIPLRDDGQTHHVIVRLGDFADDAARTLEVQEALESTEIARRGENP